MFYTITQWPFSAVAPGYFHVTRENLLRKIETQLASRFSTLEQRESVHAFRKIVVVSLLLMVLVESALLQG